MKLLSSLSAAALAGLAAAGSQDSAEVYLFPFRSSSSDTAAPSIPKELARHVLLQRASTDKYGNPLGDIPDGVDQETAISYINTFGRTRPSLFGSVDDTDAIPQLVVMLEGMTPENSRPLKDALAKAKQQPAFSVSHTPSAIANTRLINDFRASGASNPAGCALGLAINPNGHTCWSGLSSVVRYDARKDSTVINTLVKNLDRLEKFVSKGEIEAAIVLVPESSRSSPVASWSSNAPTVLHRRDTESVLSDEATDTTTTKNAAATSPADGEPFVWAKQEHREPIPQCFQSKNSCETRTNNCTNGNGACEDRYGGGPAAEGACFTCLCHEIAVVPGDAEGKGRKTVRYGGPMCQKKDVSSPFWLIAGFTISIIGILSFSIGLLFNVGEETLPGVIGAGVSRTK